MAIDPSGRGKDKTGYVVVKMLHGVLYLTAFGGLDGGYSEGTLKQLANIAKQQEVNQIVIESNMGDGMFNQILHPVLQKIYPCSMEEVRHSTQKEQRIIDTLEPVMNQHRLVVDEKLIHDDFNNHEQNHRLFFQMSRITRDRGSLRHDDLIDTLAIGVNYWTEYLDNDQDSALQEHRDAMLQQDLDKFMENATGRKQPAASWI